MEEFKEFPKILVSSDGQETIVSTTEEEDDARKRGFSSNIDLAPTKNIKPAKHAKK